MASPFAPRKSGTPFNVDILLLPDFSLLSAAATFEPLRAANRVAARDIYRWRLISADGRPVATSSGIEIPVAAPLRVADPRDALIIVSSFDVWRHSRPVLAQLRRIARDGVPMGGVEAGSWTLALAGLLDGYRATTHWEDLGEFARAFPDIEVVPDRFVVDRGRFTTGGATPALDMVLALIRAQHGPGLALDVASIFIYEQQRLAGDPQRMIALGRLLPAEPRLSEAIRLMEQSIATPLSIAAIAKRTGISVRRLETEFKRHLNTTPRGYYLDLRLNTARRLLTHRGNSIADIADATGFGSPSSFSRAFRARFSRSPTAARPSARL